MCTLRAKDDNVAKEPPPTCGAEFHPMPDEKELENATNLAVTLAWAAGAVVAG
jgi:hypothetical protein